MAAEAEYGPALKRLFTPFMTGVGPVEAGVRLSAELARLGASDALPDLVVSLGSAGSRKLEQTEVYQAVSVSYRDMDASPLGFAKGVTPPRPAGNAAPALAHPGREGGDPLDRRFRGFGRGL